MTKKELGAVGEKIALRYLLNNSFAVIDKNYYTRHGEIDIIATDQHHNQELVFVEVKTRTSDQYGWPEEAVNQLKKFRMTYAAEEYLKSHHFSSHKNYRFDTLAIELNLSDKKARLKHYRYI